jgi:hypothetical protein
LFRDPAGFRLRTGGALLLFVAAAAGLRAASLRRSFERRRLDVFLHVWNVVHLVLGVAVQADPF